MTYSFGVKSKTKLAGIHPDLLKVMTRAMETTDLDFAVIEGLRTLERQKALVEAAFGKLKGFVLTK